MSNKIICAICKDLVINGILNDGIIICSSCKTSNKLVCSICKNLSEYGAIDNGIFNCISCKDECKYLVCPDCSKQTLMRSNDNNSIYVYEFCIDIDCDYAKVIYDTNE